MSKKLKNYYIYVIRLKDDVLKHKKFKEANPGYLDGKPWSYVGYTEISIEERVNQHRSGYRKPGMGKWHNTFVKNYYKHMQPKQYKKINPIVSSDSAMARELEIQTAEKLRKKGWGVWQK